MSFGGDGGGAPPPLPQAPPPPPNPPLFGSNQAGTSQVKRKQSTNQGFGSTILGGITGSANTAQNTLLGS